MFRCEGGREPAISLDRWDNGCEGCNRKAVGRAGGFGSRKDVGSGMVSLKRWDEVGERYPIRAATPGPASGGVGDSTPAEGICDGLKSDAAEADEMNVACEMSVEFSTGMLTTGVASSSFRDPADWEMNRAKPPDARERRTWLPATLHKLPDAESQLIAG